MKNNIKGVILAGGRGTRLHPITLATNKHLLPVYNKPVIYYAIEKLVEAGVDNIMIISSPEYNSAFIELLKSGTNFKSKNTGKQIQIVYGVQNEPNGIAYGLCIAKEYIGDDNCILYLGDNIIEDDISSHVENFKDGSVVFLKQVKNPESFGVATLNKERVVEILEKPKNPKSDLAVVGLYIYDNSVFKKMLNQKPSSRGEYEITFVNNKYIEENKLKAVKLKRAWFDIGSFDSLLEASQYMKKKHHDKKGK